MIMTKQEKDNLVWFAKSLVEKMGRMMKVYSLDEDREFFMTETAWMKKQIMRTLPDARVLSSEPVYKVRLRGLECIREKDGAIEVGFFPFEKIRCYRYGPDEDFFESLDGYYRRSYSPAEPEYEAYKKKYEDPEEYPFEGLSKQAILQVMDLAEK